MVFGEGRGFVDVVFEKCRGLVNVKNLWICNSRNLQVLLAMANTFKFHTTTLLTHVLYLRYHFPVLILFNKATNRVSILHLFIVMKYLYGFIKMSTSSGRYISDTYSSEGVFIYRSIINICW